MKHELEVDRGRLKKHARAIDEQRDLWTTKIPEHLAHAVPSQDALTMATSAIDLFSAITSIHDLYMSDFVPGVATTIFEVSETLARTVESYGDVEIANTPKERRPPMMPRRHPGGGSGDLGTILSSPTE